MSETPTTEGTEVTLPADTDVTLPEDTKVVLADSKTQPDESGAYDDAPHDEEAADYDIEETNPKASG